MRPSFFGLQDRARRRSTLILATSFILLWIVANVVVFFLHIEATPCSGYPYSAGDCSSRFAFQFDVLAWTAGIVVLYLWGAYLASGRAALTLAGAHRADGPEYGQLRNIVEEMAIAAGVPVPATYVVNDPSPNAFATGRDPEHAAVTVTSGLLSTMNRAELTGVVAHEVGHIRNRDIAVTTLAVLTVGAIAVLADLAVRIGSLAALSGGRRTSKDGGARAAVVIAALFIAVVLYVVALPAALILRAALSRQRETLADASAVQYTRDPSGLRSALEKLEADTTVPQRVSTATAHLWIDHPKPASMVQRGLLAGLLDTHPLIRQRITILRQMEGLST
ncbi:MAG: M48 family metallopeptidase [Actinomycetota bacterium]